MNISEHDPAFEELLDYLRKKRGFDFSGYKRSSLVRRVYRRMQEVNCKEISGYRDYLEVTPEEFIQLFNTILINVTAFFRDKPAWDYLAAEIIPQIVERKGSDEPIRAWSAGCASGDEAYSLAILLDVRRDLPDGKEEHFEVRGIPLHADHNQLRGVSITFVDVTRHHHLQQELERANHELETANEELQSTNEELETINKELHQRTNELNNANAFLNSILSSVQVGVIVVDDHDGVLVWNEKAEDLWGLCVDEVHRRSFLGLDIGLPVERLKPWLRQVVAGEIERKDLMVIQNFDILNLAVNGDHRHPSTHETQSRANPRLNQASRLFHLDPARSRSRVLATGSKVVLPIEQPPYNKGSAENVSALSGPRVLSLARTGMAVCKQKLTSVLQTTAKKVQVLEN